MDRITERQLDIITDRQIKYRDIQIDKDRQILADNQTDG